MIVVRNVPMPITTASFVTSPASLSTAGESVMFSCVRSMSPISQPMSGMNTSPTRLVVILPKAVAMMTPMAMSMTFPREMNSLNSPKNFFIFLLLPLLSARMCGFFIFVAPDASGGAVRFAKPHPPLRGPYLFPLAGVSDGPFFSVLPEKNGEKRGAGDTK